MTMFWKTIRDAFPAGEPGHVLTRIPFWVPLIVQFWTVIPITSSSSGATLHIGDSDIDTSGSNRYAIIANSDCRGIHGYVHGATDVDSVSVGAIPGRRNSNVLDFNVVAEVETKASTAPLPSISVIPSSPLRSISFKFLN